MTPPQAQSQIRIGDTERDQAVSLLGEHYAAGRLSKEEYDERVDAAWTARTRQGLDPLFWDLPSIAPKPVTPAPRNRRRRGPRAWVLLVVAALFVAAAIVKAPWWGWLIAAWVAASFFSGGHCGGHRRHNRGSWRA